VGVAVTAQRGAHRSSFRWGRIVEHLGEISRLLTDCCLRDDFGGRWADPSQRLERAVGHSTVKLSGGQFGYNLGGASESADAVRRSTSPLQLKGDLP